MSEPLCLVVPLASDLGRLGLELRRRVFILEQNVPPEIERDSYDATATHIVALLDGDVVGVLRMVDLPEHTKIGRVAVAADCRGRGIATALMRFAMNLARSSARTRFYLTSQSDKVPFYEKLGFTAFGDEFKEAGIPHRAMKTY
jgi:predicted GNAT family N-acyltransferase